LAYAIDNAFIYFSDSLYLLALQLYSFFPCHIDGYIKSKVSGLHRLEGIYIRCFLKKEWLALISKPLGSGICCLRFGALAKGLQGISF
jgi:hypothetical protein